MKPTQPQATKILLRKSTLRSLDEDDLAQRDDPSISLVNVPDDPVAILPPLDESEGELPINSFKQFNHQEDVNATVTTFHNM